MLRRQRPNPEEVKCANAQKKKMKIRTVTFCPSDINNSDKTLLIQMLGFNHRSKTEPKDYALSHVIQDPGKGLLRPAYTARKKEPHALLEVKQVLCH